MSREAVNQEINCWIGSGEYRYTNATDYLGKRIRELPSVQPSRKGCRECENSRVNGKGEWGCGEWVCNFKPAPTTSEDMKGR